MRLHARAEKAWGTKYSKHQFPLQTQQIGESQGLREAAGTLSSVQGDVCGVGPGFLEICLLRFPTQVMRACNSQERVLRRMEFDESDCGNRCLNFFLNVWDGPWMWLTRG